MTASIQSYSIPAVSLVFIVPGLADFLYGFDCGAISYAILQLQDEDLSGVSWSLANKPETIGTLVSAAALGAFVASLCVYCTDVSRRAELQVGSLLYIAGALLQVAGSLPDSSRIALGLIWIGRFIYGLGIGVTMHAAPAYMGEMTPSSIRGLILSLKEAANCVGLLVGYQIGHAYSFQPGGWVLTFAASTIFAVSLLVLSFFLPRSARWLLLHDQDEAARQSLAFVYKDEATVDFMFDQIKQHVTHRLLTRSNSTVQWWKDPSNRLSIVVGVGVVALQQLTGPPAMLAYASTVFERAGSASNSSVYMATLQLVLTLVAAALVEKAGRKALLYVGNSMMAIALIILAICFGRFDRIVLGSMFLFIGGFQVGFGPIAWLLVAEVFSNELRSKATAVCVQVNFATYGLVQLLVPITSSLLDFNGTFAIFAMVSIYSIYFVKAFVPETKGMSLEEIDLHMDEASDRNWSTRSEGSLLSLDGNKTHTYGAAKQGD